MTSIDDVLEELKFHLPQSLQLDFTADLCALDAPIEPKLAIPLSLDEKAVMQVFYAVGRIHLDVIGELCDLSAQATAITVMQLELKHLLRESILTGRMKRFRSACRNIAVCIPWRSLQKLPIAE